MKKYICIILIGISVFDQSCTNNKTSESTEKGNKYKVLLNVPTFNVDSAYVYLKKQLDFGFRLPGSKAQTQCANWMATELRLFCDTVYIQNATVSGGDSKILPCINIIGSINPKATKRILLLTHWDSRSWAEMDTKDQDSPIVAADDAASGVGVLIELARTIKLNSLPATIGIDILFTDVEDYGRPEWGDESYCLGTQYWANHPHVPGYRAEYGILLDMVGARGAQFPLESISAKFAPEIQQKVWQAATHAGFSSFFTFMSAAEITDDHVVVNKVAGIKTIDIINLNQNPQNPFAAHWHTHADNIEIIDKATLDAVGQTLLQVLFEEANPN